ncbi:MAG TPA: hypothetical protein VLH38_01610 [Patescibacteria group bacterium]|nr:hypothetical protein [Patescibacteria group bacterium]
MSIEHNIAAAGGQLRDGVTVFRAYGNSMLTFRQELVEGVAAADILGGRVGDDLDWVVSDATYISRLIGEKAWEAGVGSLDAASGIDRAWSAVPELDDVQDLQLRGAKVRMQQLPQTVPGAPTRGYTVLGLFDSESVQELHRERDTVAAALLDRQARGLGRVSGIELIEVSFGTFFTPGTAQRAADLVAEIKPPVSLHPAGYNFDPPQQSKRVIRKQHWYDSHHGANA